MINHFILRNNEMLNSQNKNTFNHNISQVTRFKCQKHQYLL